MATRRPAAEPPIAPKLQLAPTAIERGIARLGERIAELRAFNVGSVPNGNSPELTALSADIKDTLERYFGENTSAYKRFQSAAHLQFRPVVFGDNYPQRHHYQDGARENIAQSIVLLESAQRALQQDLEDVQHESAALSVPSVVAPSALSRRVFVVHGHDEGARETIARFLEKIGFEPVILHEQASQNRTVIEKIEAYHDVGFAVVLLTPDDEGCVKGGQPEPRARQNVLLELGYFMGRLGRDKVCALKRGAVEIPSDFAGVVWVAMDAGNGWKQALGQELEAAGHEVDWNKVMRP
ncbi:putative nucleotide-binding containing TIR-like domain protein [Burkholderia pseudomallei 7894]|uniref:TIR domain-containing protein n=1 Tax=Burkholderia pseudomallei TaxID=28450 RepID=UPI00016ACF20|nr:nucleotide-binding protein [Burkholderia pseudomallei]AJX81280.1 putative nucleotide-binding containing TIR-like domain protein [Burkholderia pseudomallei 7894]ARK66882.1 nucleotide-binding protein [Burkholderia pseudomallei]OMQ68446.1 nucleotide-binding protein [Burkholderia pseudomallei]